MAVVFEMVVSILASVIVFVLAILVIGSDEKLANDLQTDPKQGMKELVVNYPALFIIMEFLQAFCVAALVEEMVKYFGYRMVETPDLLSNRGRSGPTSRNGNYDAVEPAAESSAKSLKSTGAGITVAVSCLLNDALMVVICPYLTHVCANLP